MEEMVASSLIRLQLQVGLGFLNSSKGPCYLEKKLISQKDNI
jgi:hypothetical protein